MKEKKIKIKENRYSRLELIDWWDQNLLLKSKVVVIGVGALGNEVLKNLSLLGVGNIFIVDFDKIETSNLSKAVLFRADDVGKKKVEVAKKRILEINPDINVRYIYGNALFDIGLGVFIRADLILGCVDNLETRFMINKFCYKTSKLYIDAALDSLNGDIKIFNLPYSACYECGISKIERQYLNRRFSCLRFNSKDEINGYIPTSPTISSIIAGIQTQIAIRFLHKKKIPSGKRLCYYGLSDNFFDISLQISKNCTTHNYCQVIDQKKLIHLDKKITETTIDEFFQIIKNDLGKEAVIDLSDDRDIIIKLVCEKCNKFFKYFGIVGHLTKNEVICPNCGEIRKEESISIIDNPFIFEGKTLFELGIPPLHIIMAKNPVKNNYLYYEFTGDLNDILGDNWS